MSTDLIEAKVVADSTYEGGPRLTTLEVNLHRWVLAEMNTHRVFSRNSASSRAIPLAKQIERAKREQVVPVVWASEQKGMQGGDEVTGQNLRAAQSEWGVARDDAILAADVLGDAGVHKSIANRLLEPFLMHRVIVTSTAWENFFALRLDTDAQPEIRVAAERMKAAMDASTPQDLSPYDWHLPYISDEDREQVGYRFGDDGSQTPEVRANALAVLRTVSAARCARVSYLTHDGQRSLEADMTLYDRLVTDRLTRGLGIHWSPLEHVATPWRANRQTVSPAFTDFEHGAVPVEVDHLPKIGNLLGWRSLRTTVEAVQGARTFA